MKKNYVTPNIELVEFNFEDQVVVASSGEGTKYNAGGSDCNHMVRGCTELAQG